MTVSAAEKPPTKPAENRRAAASRDLASCSGITREPEGPEPQNPRVWLSWVATHRWQRLVRFVVRSPYMEDASTAPDIIHDAMLKILSGDGQDSRRPQEGLEDALGHNTQRRSERLPVQQGAPLGSVGGCWNLRGTGAGRAGAVVDNL